MALQFNMEEELWSLLAACPTSYDRPGFTILRRRFGIGVGDERVDDFRSNNIWPWCFAGSLWPCQLLGSCETSRRIGRRSAWAGAKWPAAHSTKLECKKRHFKHPSYLVWAEWSSRSQSVCVPLQCLFCAILLEAHRGESTGAGLDENGTAREVQHAPPFFSSPLSSHLSCSLRIVARSLSNTRRCQAI